MEWKSLLRGFGPAVFMFLAVPGVGLHAVETEGSSSRAALILPPALVLRLAMRNLWTDHIIFTRSYIVSALARLPDRKTVAQRLMENQDELGQILVPYYGRKAGDRLAALLREHINIAAEVVAKSMDSDTAGLKRVQGNWAANGEQIATFLSGANPHWDREDCAAMFTDHLATTTAELNCRLAGDWQGDIMNFDRLQTHMLMFADFLTDGIIRQFPDRFPSLR